MAADLITADGHQIRVSQNSSFAVPSWPGMASKIALTSSGLVIRSSRTW
ncbi:MAG TPA: hypothetical protein VF223_03125 [Trebonia sp.]